LINNLIESFVLAGWQPRWFVLNEGILSYYRSEDDVNNGCKGSIKMSVCDVTGVCIHPSAASLVFHIFLAVHNTDSTRLDLTIPGEAHFYVKAATAQERQQWLVALGSCKACLTNGKPSTNSIGQCHLVQVHNYTKIVPAPI
jgi:pleckstrin family protein A (phosphoinositide binding specific) protein 8